MNFILHFPRIIHTRSNFCQGYSPLSLLIKK
nr:MAG TPA: envelope glycoprotein [Caudoviricetes sp.]